MKFVYDKKTGQMLPENMLYRADSTELERAVYAWLEKDPKVVPQNSYSTRSIANLFLQENKNFSHTEIDKIRDAIAHWSNTHQSLLQEAERSSTEDACGAPGMGCGTAGLSGSCFGAQGDMVGGVPPTVGALQISSPVLPKKKNKTSSKEYVDSTGDPPMFTYPDWCSTDKWQRPVLAVFEKEGEKTSYIAIVKYSTGTRGVRPNYVVLPPNVGYEPRTGFFFTMEGESVIKSSYADAYNYVRNTYPDYKQVSRDPNAPKKYAAGEAVKSTIPKSAPRTGDCYKLAWKAFYDNISKHPLLCHGVVVGRNRLQGVKFSHAWVEVGDEVIDYTADLFKDGFPKDAYYGLGNIDEKTVFKYTPEEVMQKAIMFETYGPWEDILWQYS